LGENTYFDSSYQGVALGDDRLRDDFLCL